MTSTPKSSGRSYHHGDLRRVLIEAGAAELEANGIEAFSLRAVSRRAGVSHSAPAHHFGDIKGLLTALAAYGFDQLHRNVVARKEEEAELKASTAAALAYIDFALQYSSLFSLMFASFRPDFADPHLDAASSNAFNSFVAGVSAEQAQTRHATRGFNKPAMAQWAKMHGIATLLMTGRMRSVLRMNKSAQREALIDLLDG